MEAVEASTESSMEASEYFHESFCESLHRFHGSFRLPWKLPQLPWKLSASMEVAKASAEMMEASVEAVEASMETFTSFRYIRNSCRRTRTMYSMHGCDFLVVVRTPRFALYADVAAVVTPLELRGKYRVMDDAI